MTNPAAWLSRTLTLRPLGGQGTGLGESILFLVLAPAGTAGAALHHGLAALVEDGLAFATPGRERQVLLVGQAGGLPGA